MRPQNAVLVFKALSDPARLRVMRLLLRREVCVCEIMFILGMEQTRVSHHMRVLRDVGLAEDRREGRWIIYRIPAGSRRLVRDLLRGVAAGVGEQGAELASDLRKLQRCVRENIRGRVCVPGPAQAVRGTNGGGRGAKGQGSLDSRLSKRGD